MDKTPADKPIIRLAARLLAETVYRHGGLAGNSLGSDAAEGVRLHRIYTESMQDKYGERVESERTLAASFQTEDHILEVSGRCDLLIHPAPAEEATDSISTNSSSDTSIEQTDRYNSSIITISEIKTHSLKPHQLPQGGDELHWAQLMLYGWMFCSQNQQQTKNNIQLELIYLSIDDRSRQYWRRSVSKNKLQEFFDSSCEEYLKTAGNWLKWQKLRDESAKNVTFPYTSVRSGQKELMNEVLAAIRQNSILFAQAPTGTGKTMSTMFPAVRALGHHLTDYVFYLTAMTSTRRAAVAALSDLRNTGLHIRSIEIKAKEKLCLEPEIYCDTSTCPFAIMYYNNLPDAIAALLAVEEISPDTILATARKFQVCPFELSLDISLFCDVIICDYNYAFDPRVKLDRFFGQQPRSSLLLVDEAHNLPARSREMFSAKLEEKLFDNVLELLQAAKNDQSSITQTADTKNDENKAIQTQALLNALGGDSRELNYLFSTLKQIKAWFDKLRPQLVLAKPEAGFELVEQACREQDSMKAPGFIGMRISPVSLLSMLGRCRFFIRSVLDEITETEYKKIFRDLMFSLAFFSRIAELFDRGCHITTAKFEENSKHLVIELLCLDSAPFLSETYYLKRPVVFFSATLTPMSYYVGLLDSKAVDDPPEQLNLASPFPAENMLLLLHTGISIKYKDRESTMPELIELVLAAVRQKVGNYLLFVPSYAYLQKFRRLLKIISPQDIDCLLQIPGMDDQLKQKFLSRFDKHGNRTLLAVAVMGSFFNEGIDLMGDKLSGVIVAGTGMPMISPEREILRQYYDAGIGSGFAYSYIYPGFNRVQQAAGRVIRSENDRGFILLIDERYEKYEYKQLFPHEWLPIELKTQDEICETIQEFWQGS
ncbi:MAG: ATP-dependent DNA helicase [Clostridiaceae bacterium]|nr:ATP-dependent DNA helicase [Clostridiaceae bacterium]